jgi:hypothetical protein
MSIGLLFFTDDDGKQYAVEAASVRAIAQTDSGAAKLVFHGNIPSERTNSPYRQVVDDYTLLVSQSLPR